MLLSFCIFSGFIYFDKQVHDSYLVRCCILAERIHVNGTQWSERYVANGKWQ